MKLVDIIDLWRVDSVIDKFKLTDESLNISQLHSKYYEIYMNEKRVYVKEAENFKNLEMHKTFWYGGKYLKPQLDELGWKQFSITLAKSDIPIVVNADEDIINKKINMAEQLEKVKFVESILQSIHQRSFNIKNAIEYEKFLAGM